MTPEVTVKIQFLRLIHSFCDHNEEKRLLLTPLELDEIRRIEEQLNLPSTSETMASDPRKMASGASGLLTRIVEVLKKEPSISPYK